MPPRFGQTQLPRDQPFDYVLLTDRLRSYGAVRDRISRLLARGDLVRVKKGLYVPGRTVAVREVDPLVLSGMVYGPSCVSFETALARHELVPERVAEITCATTQRRREFDTPVGRFSYHPVPRAVFGAEVERVESSGGHFFLARPERALCDCAARQRGFGKQEDIGRWVEESLRIEAEALDRLTLAAVREIAPLYHRRAVTLLARWLERRGRARRLLVA